MLTTVAAALGIVVCAMSGVRTFWALAIAVTLTRGLGQSALSVISLAMVGQWFVRGIDNAMAIYSIVMSIGFMIAFPIVGALVQTRGWRFAWLAIGISLIAVLAPAKPGCSRRRILNWSLCTTVHSSCTPCTMCTGRRRSLLPRSGSFPSAPRSMD